MVSAALIGVLIFLLIIALVAFLGFYIIGKMAIPDPTVALMVRVVFGVLLLLALLEHFYPFSMSGRALL